VVAPGLSFRLITAVTLVTGTMFLMWLGEQITERGLGNGISLLIFAGIAAGLPNAVGLTLEQARTGAYSIPLVLGIAVLVVVVTAFVVFVERAVPEDSRQLRQAAGRQQGLSRAELAPSAQVEHGRRHSPDLRLVDHPVPGDDRAMVRQQRKHDLAARSRRNTGTRSADPRNPVRVGHHFLLFFLYRAAVQPKETAENLKKSGAFIPGYRPGEQTARYIEKITLRLTLLGSLYLVVVCFVPNFLIAWKNVPFYFGGTSLLIIVVVTMDFMTQVQAYLMSQQYESLLKKANFKGGLPTR
jgi:preprotein translocase subunit SecY